MDGGIRLLAGILIWGQRLPEGYIGKNQFFFLYYHYLIPPIMYNKELAFWGLCPGDRFLGGKDGKFPKRSGCNSYKSQEGAGKGAGWERV